MSVIYVKFQAISSTKGSHIDLSFLLKWHQNFIFGFIRLFILDPNRMAVPETFKARIRGIFRHICQPSWISITCKDSKHVEIDSLTLNLLILTSTIHF